MTMVIVSPLRIRLWDPFQMAYMAYNWDDPPSMETSTQLWKHIHAKKIQNYKVGAVTSCNNWSYNAYKMPISIWLYPQLPI